MTANTTTIRNTTIFGLIGLAFLLAPGTAASRAWAGTQPLIQATSDKYPDVYTVSVLTNEQGDFAALTYDNGKGDQATFTTKALESNQVLVHIDQHDLDVAYIKTLPGGFNPKDGGLFQISYKFNVALMPRRVRVIYMQVVRAGSRWIAYRLTEAPLWNPKRQTYSIDREPQPFANMKFVSAMFGISRITTW